MRGFPIVAGAGVDLQRHLQLQHRLGRLLHHRLRHLHGLVDLILRRLEHELVMHLEQHARVEPGGGERRHHADHGAADDVGGAPLDRRVDGGALEIAAE